MDALRELFDWFCLIEEDIVLILLPTSILEQVCQWLPEEVPELEADAQSMNGEVHPASTFEGGEESRPTRRGGRDASMDNYTREMAAKLTRIELSLQQAREEQTARWAQQMAWHAQQVAWQDRWDQYMEEQRAYWKSSQQWQQEMKQRFSSWPNYPPPRPK